MADCPFLLQIYPDGNSSTKNYDPLDYRSRRPVAYSSGLVLLVTFVSGYGDTTEKYIGFKAQYEFYPGKTWVTKFFNVFGLKSVT